MSKRYFLVLFTLVVFTKSFSQKAFRGYDAYVADTFDLLNQKTFIPIALEDSAGILFHTSSLIGKTIYVDFWFTSCPPCLKEIPYSIALQQFFAADTNIVFLNICIDNIERKQAWKQMVHNKKMKGIQLFYVGNRPQKINLLREYEVTFPTYLLVNTEMKIIGYNVPRPSEKGWVHWALVQAEKNILLSVSYKQLINGSKSYKEFIAKNWQIILSSQP